MVTLTYRASPMYPIFLATLVSTVAAAATPASASVEIGSVSLTAFETAPVVSPSLTVTTKSALVVVHTP